MATKKKSRKQNSIKNVSAQKKDLFLEEVRTLAKLRGITDYVLAAENEDSQAIVFSTSRYSVLYGLVCLIGRSLDEAFKKDKERLNK